MTVRRVIETGTQLADLPALDSLPATRSAWAWQNLYGWLAILTLAIATRIYGLTAAAVWGDEGSSLLMSQYSLSGIWFHAAHDVHPPLYFMLLHGWIELFGDSLLFPFALSAIGLGVIWLGLLWQRHERTVGAKLRRRLPQPLRELIENRQ